MKKEDKRFAIEVNYKQLCLLDQICETYERLLCGQLELSLQEICESAWRKIHGTDCSEEFWEMRHKLEGTLKGIEHDYWGLSGGRYNGVGYDPTGDIVWDMHKVMEHARFLSWDKKTQDEMRWTVMADTPSRWGEEPLITVKEIKNEARGN